LVFVFAIDKLLSIYHGLNYPCYNNKKVTVTTKIDERYFLAGGQEFLTAEDVSAYLRNFLSTVYKLTRNKVLLSFKIGKHGRYRRGAIENKIKNLKPEITRNQTANDFIYTFNST
jgi:hypothetical protein